MGHVPGFQSTKNVVAARTAHRFIADLNVGAVRGDDLDQKNTVPPGVLSHDTIRVGDPDSGRRIPVNGFDLDEPFIEILECPDRPHHQTCLFIQGDGRWVLSWTEGTVRHALKPDRT